MRSNHIAMSLVINAPIERVWAALADWESQGDWMLQTRVEVTSQIREGVGTSISAFTGIGKLGVMDHMVVTSWQPPHICDVMRTGKIIKGTGRFELVAINADTTRLIGQKRFWLHESYSFLLHRVYTLACVFH